MPDQQTLAQYQSLRPIEHILYSDNLWQLNRETASLAVFIGMFVAFMPIPGQMVFAALLAWWFKASLPLSVAVVWVSNPLTMPPMYYGAFRLGEFLLGIEPQPFSFELSWAWVIDSINTSWRPLLLGCGVCGLFFGGLSYAAMRLVWRFHVVRRWKQRKILRLKKPHS